MQEVTDCSKNKVRRKWHILVVDDHPLVRSGLSALISAEPDLEVCGETGAVSEALNLAATTSPDLAIVDLSLTDSDGLELVKRLRSHHPALRLLVCSVYDETLFAQRALAAGAMGYINKKEATIRIVEAIRQVLQGELFVSDQVAQLTLQELTQRGTKPHVSVASLSDRELQVYRLIGEGLRTSQIAGQLHLSVKTIESHKEKIKKKLNLTSASKLARHAVQWSQDQI